MIPILYDKTETSFVSNGLGRLRDCISATVVEERNGIYELDFEYPVSGANYDLIQLGRTVGVVTDDTGNFQPFDIVSYSKPIEGVVTFHCVHISYRQSYLTATGSNINSLSDAFDLLETAEPDNPFTYWTDKTSSGFMAAADGTPRSVRQMLGGVEGSILDTYGGEYEWDRFTVRLWSARGQKRDFTIRYGVNMLEYNDEVDSQGTYSSCVPFWKGNDTVVVGNRVDAASGTVTGRGECVPLDLTDKFESEPTTAQLESLAQSLMDNNSTYLPTQNITVSFVRLQDMEEYANLSNLFKCGLCDMINVVFPDYGTTGQFKIVKTTWNVLEGRYESMELGTLSATLSEALGISNGELTQAPAATVIEKGTSGDWTYRKWSDGTAECWCTWSGTLSSYTSIFGGYGFYTDVTFPTDLFNVAPVPTFAATCGSGFALTGTITNLAKTGARFFVVGSSSGSQSVKLYISVVGTWK